MKKWIFSMSVILAFSVSCCRNDVIVASRHGVKLDSDVYAGGGTDQTEKIQSILDKAQTKGRLHLVMDGAALISNTLKVYSNTTIECPDKSCGFFLADSSNCSIITNAHGDVNEIHDRNITLSGGTYNHNSPGQVHSNTPESGKRNALGQIPTHEAESGSRCVFATEFFGVENLVLKDLAIANQRTYAFCISNWKYVTVENIHIDRRERHDAQNQDGLHFLGPGRFLTLRNIYGNVGDDMIAIAPDEVDKKSSITDVLIDGMHLEEADQAVRILCYGEGKVDRVVIKNVTGTYRSYGFYVNPWYPGEGGHFGNIIFDTIDLRPMKNNYDYSEPFLFKLGGRIQCITLRNIYQNDPDYPHLMFELGRHYMRDYDNDPKQPCEIDCMIVDGLYINEYNPDAYQRAYFDLQGTHIGTLLLDNVIVNRPGQTVPQGALISLRDSRIDKTVKGTVETSCLKSFTTNR